MACICLSQQRCTLKNQQTINPFVRLCQKHALISKKYLFIQIYKIKQKNNKKRIKNKKKQEKKRHK